MGAMRTHAYVATYTDCPNIPLEDRMFSQLLVALLCSTIFEREEMLLHSNCSVTTQPEAVAGSVAAMRREVRGPPVSFLQRRAPDRGDLGRHITDLTRRDPLHRVGLALS